MGGRKTRPRARWSEDERGNRDKREASERAKDDPRRRREQSRLVRTPLAPRCRRDSCESRSLQGCRAQDGLPLRLVHWREGHHAPRLVRLLGVLQGLSAESYIEIVVLQLHPAQHTHTKILIAKQ